MTNLQVALDVINISRAKNIANECVKGGIDWIEAGTPLIKSEGMDAIRELANDFDKPIVADMKTMDTGKLEVEVAAKSGANIVSILGTASNSTIREAVEASKKYNVEIMVDLIGVDDLVNRARKLQSLGVDYLLVHTGIDEQMAGKDPLDNLKEVYDSTSLPLAVAGGLNKKTAPKAVKSGANVVIVGGAIIRSENPKKSTEEIKKSIKNVDISSKLKSSKQKRRKEVLNKISTANLSDAVHRKGVMKKITKRSGEKSKIFGRALTVKTIPGDWAKPVEALEKAKNGDILVVDAGGKELAVWGELASNSALNKGVRGIIIDGAVRDLEDIQELGFPVWSKYVSPEAGEPKGFGEIGSEISCGNTTLKTGDYILADKDGVVVIEKERVDEMLNRAEMVFDNEERVRKEIKDNSTLSEVIKLDKWEKKH